MGRGEVTSPLLGNASRLKASEPESSTSESLLDFDAVILPTAENANKFECAHCGTNVTTAWRRAPGEIDRQKKYPKVYCNDCGYDWARYVQLPSLDAQKENGKKLKKEKEKDKDKDPNGKVFAVMDPLEDLYVRKKTDGKLTSLNMHCLLFTPISLVKPQAAVVESPMAVKRKRGDPKTSTTKKVKEQVQSTQWFTCIRSFISFLFIDVLFLHRIVPL